MSINLESRIPSSLYLKSKKIAAPLTDFDISIRFFVNHFNESDEYGFKSRASNIHFYPYKAIDKKEVSIKLDE